MNKASTPKPEPAPAHNPHTGLVPPRPLPMKIGVVAIGRNEGDRLKRCLASVIEPGRRVVYVDSGSTDGSVAHARSQGVEVVELDTSIKFTAARARNAGWRRLLEIQPEVEAVQFVDGDCEVQPGYLKDAALFLQEHDDVAVVSGRRRERHPDASIYNRLCDLEWDTPKGQVQACHGDTMIRVKALQAVNGFEDSMIAGEEPELSVRLRLKSWKLWRIHREMTLHDAAMTRFGQWWKRQVRAGHAYAEGYAKHGQGPTQHNAKQIKSIRIWGVIMPACFAVGWLPVWLHPLAGIPWLLMMPLIVLQFAKIAADRRDRHGDRWGHCLLYAGFVLLGKLPNAMGVRQYHKNRKSGGSTLIEYKGAEATEADQPASEEASRSETSSSARGSAA